MPTIRIVNDYFVRWPVKIDGAYDEYLPDRLSSALVRDIRQLAEWWQERFAVRITDPPVRHDAADVAELAKRKNDVLSRLRDELGPEYVIDPR